MLEVRYYPFKNSFRKKFNIDARIIVQTALPSGSTLDLDFMFITIKRLLLKYWTPTYKNDN